MVREYARQVEKIEARDAKGSPRAVKKIDKNLPAGKNESRVNAELNEIAELEEESIDVSSDPAKSEEPHDPKG
jgi:hypothetical protein